MSANGQVLEIHHNGGYWERRASWPAPFFALYLPDWPEDGDEPLLIHCESIDHAQAHARRGARILNADFTSA